MKALREVKVESEVVGTDAGRKTMAVSYDVDAVILALVGTV